MTRHRRALAVLAAAGVALLLSSCGVEAGDQGPTTASASETTTPSSTPSTTDGGKTTTTRPELSDAEQQAVDAMVKTYVDLGFTEEEATCLSEGMMASGAGQGSPDMSSIMDIVNECDIPLSRFTDIQENLGGGSTTDVFEKSLATGFSNMGMTEEQASCVAKAYVDEFGTDTSSSSDPAAMQKLFQQCDVDLTDLSPGG